MRAPIYLVCAALAVAVRSEDSQNYMNLEPVDVSADPETINYLLPKLTAKYRPNSEWRGIADPRFYVLTEMDSDDNDNQGYKPKRVRNKRYQDYASSLSLQSNIQALRNLMDKTNYRQRAFANRHLIQQLTSS